MIYIAASAILKEDVFEIQSIYIISENQDSYILTKNGGWEPLGVDMDLDTLVDVTYAQEFYSSRLVYSEIRQYNDDDAKSFAMFMHKQLADSRESGLHKENFYKRLFKVIQMIGNPYLGGKK